MKVKLLSCVWLLATPWTAAYQAPPSIGFSRQEYWSGLPLPSPTFQPAAAAKSLQLCLTLCDPIDGSPPGSPIPGILQARTLKWVAISSFNAWKWKVKVKLLSCVWLLATPWTVACHAPLSMGFSRQEYWSEVPWGVRKRWVVNGQLVEQSEHIHLSLSSLSYMGLACGNPEQIQQ